MANIITTLGAPLIAQKRKETLEAQAIRKTVNFSDINIIDEKSIEYKGTRMEAGAGFFKQLLKMLGMSQTFANSFEKLFNVETKVAFINRIKDAMASNSGKLSNVVLIVNPSTKSIVGIAKEATDMISNDRFLDVVDRIVDNGGLDITNWSVNPTTGLVNINTFNPNSEFSVKGLSDEVFKGGITFQNSPNGGFQVLPYVNRLWCTNGMTAPFAEEAYTLQSLDATTMEKFFQQMNDLRKNNYAPVAFADKVRQAVVTPASLLEMKEAYNMIEGIAGARAESWVPLQENMNVYAKAGFEGMSNSQLKGAKSNQSVWSVVNGLTHFATHGRSIIEADMSESDSTRLMVRAGNIFGSPFDHANQIPNVFGDNALQEHFQVGAMLS